MKAILFILACFMALFFVIPAFGGTILSKNQQLILQKAYNAGTLVGWPLTMEAIVWQESSLGKYRIGDDGKSLGLANVQVQTARIIIKQNSWLPQYTTNYSIARALLHNDEINLLIASIYFRNCYNQFKNWPQALICYNGGPQTATNWGRRNAENFPYVITIRKRLEEIRQLPVKDNFYGQQPPAISPIPAINP